MGTHFRLGSCAAPTAVAAGGSSQRRSQRQQGKAPAAADKGKDCEYVTMPSELVQRVVEACVSWPARGAGGGAGGGGAVARRRYDESEGVNMKVQVTMDSCWTSMSHRCHIDVVSHMHEQCHP